MQTWMRRLFTAIIYIVIHIGIIAYCGSQLPASVATSFDLSGSVSGNMERGQFLWISFFTPLLIAGITIGVLGLLKRVPPNLVNMPRANFWRRPENFRQACEMMLDWGINFATSLLLFVDGLTYLTMVANRSVPPALDSGSMGLLVGVFVAFEFIFIGQMMFRFNRMSR